VAFYPYGKSGLIVAMKEFYKRHDKVFAKYLASLSVFLR
jgi:hypothetical protein